MATSNFHNVNATHIFACSLENEWDYEDLIDNLTYEFKNHADWYDGNKSDPHELRSFPSRVLGSLTKSFSYNNFSLEVWVSPVIRSGYYEGCNLDWHVRYYVNGSEDESYESHPRVQTLVESYVDYIENIFNQYSQPLGVTARFSNGETIYHAINQ